MSVWRVLIFLVGLSGLFPPLWADSAAGLCARWLKHTENTTASYSDNFWTFSDLIKRNWQRNFPHLLQRFAGGEPPVSIVHVKKVDATSKDAARLRAQSALRLDYTEYSQTQAAAKFLQEHPAIEWNEQALRYKLKEEQGDAVSDYLSALGVEHARVTTTPATERNPTSFQNIYITGTGTSVFNKVAARVYANFGYLIEVSEGNTHIDHETRKIFVKQTDILDDKFGEVLEKNVADYFLSKQAYMNVNSPAFINARKIDWLWYAQNNPPVRVIFDEVAHTGNVVTPAMLNQLYSNQEQVVITVDHLPEYLDAELSEGVRESVRSSAARAQGIERRQNQALMAAGDTPRAVDRSASDYPTQTTHVKVGVRAGGHWKYFVLADAKKAYLPEDLNSFFRSASNQLLPGEQMELALIRSTDGEASPVTNMAQPNENMFPGISGVMSDVERLATYRRYLYGEISDAHKASVWAVDRDKPIIESRVISVGRAKSDGDERLVFISEQ